MEDRREGEEMLAVAWHPPPLIAKSQNQQRGGWKDGTGNGFIVNCYERINTNRPRDDFLFLQEEVILM